MISLVLPISFLAFAQGGHVWNFESETIGQYKIQDATFAEADVGYGLVCNSKVMPVSIESRHLLPTKDFTISTWVSIEEPRRWGRHNRLCTG